MIRKNSIRALLGVNISKSRPVTMLRARHAIHFKPILDFGEGQLSQAGRRVGVSDSSADSVDS
jgi:hypothetical protein